MPTVTVQPTLLAAVGWANTANLAVIDSATGSIGLSIGDSQTVTFNCQHSLPAQATVTGVRVTVRVASSGGTEIQWEPVFASFTQTTSTTSTVLEQLTIGTTTNAAGVTRASLNTGFVITLNANEVVDFATTAILDGISLEVTYSEITSAIARTVLLLDE